MKIIYIGTKQWKEIAILQAEKRLNLSERGFGICIGFGQMGICIGIGKKEK